MPSNVNTKAPKAPIQLCFCADGKYADFILPALESVIRSNSSGRTIAVDIVLDKEPSRQFRENIISICSGEVRTHVIDASQFENLLEVTHITRGMYYRLMIPELVLAPKVLYLDCDVLVRKDISSLFDTNLDGNLAAAVVNPFHDATRLGLKEGDAYFNSGVLLINTVEWLRDGVKQKVLDYLSTNKRLLQMPDQDALNAVMYGRWVELDPTYNCQVSMLLGYRSLDAELNPRWQTEFLNDPAIMHFSAGHKQWHRSSRIRYAREYRTLRTSVMVSRRGFAADFFIGRIRQVKYALIESNPYFF
ncbi:glycosyltransferase family 8 protein [Stenotrophomonas sp. PUT21]|uniref:glycosyltransferase family 8 protein n=1 Tax=Stenotrophomonas TaxID=40323 RepID=UPI003B7C11C0